MLYATYYCTSKYLLYPISKCVDIADFQDRDLRQLKRYLSHEDRGDIRVSIRKLSNKSVKTKTI